jgi:SET domain-containing protein
MLKMPDTLTKEWTGFGGFNHSCNHNIGKLAFGGTEHRKVLRDIRRGEEITVNYGIGKHPGCNCESCRESRGMK